MYKKIFWRGIVLCLFAVSAKADDLRLGVPVYNGTGCPTNSASIALSPDQKAISILFGSFMAEAGGETYKTMDRKSCNLAIPVHVPQGYSISLFKIDYRGFTFVPYGGQARFSVEYFFAGSRGPLFQKTFRGPLEDEYTINNDLLAEAIVWSACGADTILRVNSNMIARTNGEMESTLASVDSADIESGMIYHIQWRRCR